VMGASTPSPKLDVRPAMGLAMAAVPYHKLWARLAVPQARRQMVLPAPGWLLRHGAADETGRELPP